MHSEKDSQNELMALTALTEEDAVAVDICGEKQEARQRQAVLQKVAKESC